MLKRLIVAALPVLALSAASHAGLCSDLVLIRVATGDTALHFSQKGLRPGEFSEGECHYETDLFGSGVQWWCREMYLIKDGQSLYIPQRQGEFSQKNLTFVCESKY